MYLMTLQTFFVSNCLSVTQVTQSITIINHVTLCLRSVHHHVNSDSLCHRMSPDCDTNVTCEYLCHLHNIRMPLCYLWLPRPFFITSAPSPDSLCVIYITSQDHSCRLIQGRFLVTYANTNYLHEIYVLTSFILILQPSRSKLFRLPKLY